MDISTNFDRGLNFHQHGLFHEDLLDETDQTQDFLLLKLDLFAGLGASDCKEPFYDAVEIDINFLCHCYLFVSN